MLGKVWPEPASSAAGSRMMQLIRIFLQQQWDVCFATAAGESEFAADLKSLGVKTASIELNNASFDRFIQHLRPTLVVFDRFTTEEQFGWRVAEHCPGALRILDTEDLHCLRFARQQAVKEKRDFKPDDLMNEVSKREIASIYRCDLSLIISSYELKLLQTFFKIAPQLLHYIPFLFEPVSKSRQKKLPDFTSRQHFISIGNFLHEPNWDAVLFLKQSIWPLIRKELPKAELHVYGAYPSHKVFALHNPKEKFYIKGRAKDVEDVMQAARVCLAPLRFGAGLKGKLADAMRCGLPSVTTHIGAEAMHGTLAWNGAIADEPGLFAKAAVKLYSDEKTWNTASEQGFRILNVHYAPKKYGSTFIQKIQSLQSDIHAHRRRNFTGAMLLQHTALSSRYMALWIEAKNKK